MLEIGIMETNCATIHLSWPILHLSCFIPLCCYRYQCQDEISLIGRSPLTLEELSLPCQLNGQTDWHTWFAFWSLANSVFRFQCVDFCVNTSFGTPGGTKLNWISLWIQLVVFEPIYLRKSHHGGFNQRNWCPCLLSANGQFKIYISGTLTNNLEEYHFVNCWAAD